MDEKSRFTEAKMVAMRLIGGYAQRGMPDNEAYEKARFALRNSSSADLADEVIEYIGKTFRWKYPRFPGGRKITGEENDR